MNFLTKTSYLKELSSLDLKSLEKERNLISSFRDYLNYQLWSYESKVFNYCDLLNIDNIKESTLSLIKDSFNILNQFYKNNFKFQVKKESVPNNRKDIIKEIKNIYNSLNLRCSNNRFCLASNGYYESYFKMVHYVTDYLLNVINQVFNIKPINNHQYINYPDVLVGKTNNKYNFDVLIDRIKNQLLFFHNHYAINDNYENQNKNMNNK